MQTFPSTLHNAESFVEDKLSGSSWKHIYTSFLEAKRIEWAS